MGEAEDADLIAAREALARGDGGQAVALLNSVLTRNSNNTDALYLMASCAHAAGQREAAITLLRQAANGASERADCRHALGTLLHEAGDSTGAEAAFRSALAIQPDLAASQVNLGNLLRQKGALEEAAACYQAALAAGPGMAEVETNLGFVRQLQGLAEVAIAHHEAALRSRPGFGIAQHNRLLAMQYSGARDPKSIYDAHIDWARRQADPLTPDDPVHDNDRDPDRRLRLGIVSPDFRNHPVALFLLPLVEQLPRTDFTLALYSSGLYEDAVTQRFRDAADLWRPVRGAGDDDLASLIRADKVDILIDAAGHTADNRLLAFARRPAPVQVTWLGYPDTTGMAAMDARLSDAVADPPGIADTFCRERLIRLDGGFLCYRAPAYLTPRPPAEAGRPVVFGCFNNLSKVQPAVIACWAAILCDMPESRLLLKARSLDDPGTRQRYRLLFEEHGIDPARVALEGHTEGVVEHLRSYDRIDIALDTFPYNGTTTTFDALYMGVPVIALAGDRHAARVGASILTHLDLEELIAPDAAGYAARAVALASDRARLSALSEGLRERLKASSLMDEAGFAWRFAAVMRGLWRGWCGLSPQR